MREEVAICHKMSKLDKVAISYWLASDMICWIIDFIWNDLPDIVGVIEGVACHLRALTGHSTVIVP